ncbi:MAG: DegQ family serine endoprotease [Alphaproteobacteria bacterium]|nr:DegQ family serine endoprotease [Alphaproteobacteria bacterium]
MLAHPIVSEAARRRPAPVGLQVERIVGIAVMSGLLVLSSLPAQARQAPESFADLAEKLLPTVVNISTIQAPQGQQGPQARPDMPQVPPGSPFEEFFKHFFDRQRPDSGPRRATSLGSGFIVDRDGYVVTNDHVIADADEITVILHDDTRHKAKLVGRDAKTDIALLKIEAGRKLVAAKWGDSTVARIGDWVIAIGNPFGLGGTVTAGIISAHQRNINAGPYDSFIQTDASINRGNSGGPMFNVNGEVIGINTAIFSPSGGSVGIGFAVPSSMARRVVDQLREFGRTKRGWLGVRIQSVTEEIAESLQLGKPRGALVASVIEGGPAAAAKVEQGDVVIGFDGKPIDQMRELPRVVAETSIGKEVDLEVWRKGAAKKLRVTVGELEEAENVVAAATPGGDTKGPAAGVSKIADLGLTLTQIDDRTRREFSIPDNVRGVVVTEVDGSGPGAEKDLRPGDVIVEVSQEAVTSPAQVANSVRRARDSGRRSVLLLVNRGGDLSFKAVRLGKG